MFEALLAQARSWPARHELPRDVKLVVEVFVTLFVIMDPPGTMPLFLSLTSGRSNAMRKKLAGQAVIVAFFVITTFALFGQQILDYLGITLSSMQVSGGLLLLLVALELLTGQADDPVETQNVNVALVPLGTPLLAGPGAIVATIVFVKEVDDVGAGAGTGARHRRGARRAVAVPALLGRHHPGHQGERRHPGHPHRRPAAVGDRGAADRRRRDRDGEGGLTGVTFG